ncbi:MAG: ATP-grasp domain-containing protein, partial [Methylomonas sp.]
MNIHEYQAKLLLKNYSVPIPRGDVAVTWSQAEQVLEKLGGDAWVVKAQIHAGARGKAGGVKVARGKAEVEAFCRERLGKRLVTHQTDSDGLPVDVLLIEEASAIKHEFYVSLVLDREAECLMFIASAAGGMDIEAVAEESPEKIVRVPVPPAAGYQPYQGRLIAAALGLAKEQESQLQGILRGVYDLCVAKDASQIEINPLIENAAGQLIALDAKINFDDNAVPSHADISALRDIVQEN